MRRISWKVRRVEGDARSVAPRAVAALLLPLAIAASGVVVACSDNITAPGALDASAAKGEHPVVITSENVGIYHNQFLDFSFPAVRAAAAAGADHARLCRVIAQAMRDFVSTRKLPVNPSTIRDDIAGGRCVSSLARGEKPNPRRSIADDGVPVSGMNAIIADMSYAVETGRTQSELAALFSEKVAYARANFPEAEAEVVAAAASVGLSSVEYWDANYTTQEAELLATKTSEAYSLTDAGGSSLSGNAFRASDGLIAAPAGRREYDWRSLARKVGGSDLAGAVKGGIKGWSGGLHGIGVGALVEGGAASAGALIGIALQ